MMESNSSYSTKALSAETWKDFERLFNKHGGVRAGWRNYPKLKLAADSTRFWRITCFFVDRDFRRRGVAEVALQAALDAIRERGGGIVEAYPVTNKRAVAIWFGTVRMFEREQFQKIADLGKSNIVMRRRV